MKQFKKFMALFSVALLCLLPVFSSTITAEASTPNTWYLKYVDSINEWRFQPGSWETNGYHRELYYMHQDIKDGDIIVIDGNQHIELEVAVNLSNLTILNPGTSIVTAKSVDQFYAGGNSVSAINCDVKEAYVYEQCTVNFNNNVGYLEVIAKDGPKATIAAAGTVNHVKGMDGTTKYYEAYNFAAGKLSILGGAIKTNVADYSTTPSAAPAPTTPSAPTTSTPSSDDYDDVPKTGDFNLSPVLLLTLAAICLLGSYKLKTK